MPKKSFRSRYVHKQAKKRERPFPKSSEIPKTRMFDGERYRFSGYSIFKDSAYSDKKRLQAQGYKVRTVKLKGYYFRYIRKT